MKVCVIGAGLSGLVTIKELNEEAHEVVCYEKSSRFGGVFGLHDGKSTAYDEGMLTVSNYFMAFSSLKPEEAERRYWTWGEYHQYLQTFVERFDLLPQITFNAEVREIERTTAGKWLVRTLIEGEERAELFDALAVCTGRYRVPLMPELSGLSGFGGEVWHSFDYKNAAPFKDKRVVCIGFGESGADICHQVAQVAKTATLVMRQPPFVLPRSLKHFIGVDVTSDALTCRYIESIVSETAPLAQAIFDAYSWIAPLQFEFMNEPEMAFLREWGHMSNHVFGKFPIKNDIFVRDILNGKLDFNLFGVETVAEDYVICGDGQKIEADVLIFNTGYLNDFGFFTNAPEIKEVERNMRKLYKHMLHPTYGSSLAFIGFVRPESGNLPTCAELQARYFARLCSGKAQLPNQKTLEEVAQIEGEEEEASYYRKSYLTESVRYYPYTSGLAKLIGCEPKPPLLNPKLLAKYYLGAAVPNWFRLSGPGSNAEEAEQVIMHLPIVIPFPIIVGIGVTKGLMTLASLLDQLTFQQISKKLAQRKPTPQAFLQRELKQKQINHSERLRTLCPDKISWHHLKYKLHKQFNLPPKAIKADLTAGQLFELCGEGKGLTPCLVS